MYLLRVNQVQVHIIKKDVLARKLVLQNTFILCSGIFWASKMIKVKNVQTVL